MIGITSVNESKVAPLTHYVCFLEPNPKMAKSTLVPRMAPPKPATTMAEPVESVLTRTNDASEPSSVPISENAMFCVAFLVPNLSDTVAGIAVTPPPYAKDRAQNARA